MTTGTLIRTEVRRREDGALVRGAGRFVDDVTLPRLSAMHALLAVGSFLG